METKLVSIIMPAYNGEKFIEKAVQSVLAQSYSNWELIVVDDGSTDQTASIIKAITDPRIKYVYQENRGLGGARNTGILASKAEFVGLLDADDEWMPNYLEKMMTLVQQYPEAVVYYCCAQGMDANGNDLSQVFGRVIYEIGQRLLRANFLIPSTVVLRRSVIVDVGLFEENNRDLHGCEDWDLWLRLFPSHQFAGTTETLVRYRLHENTFSANSSHMQKAVRTVIEKNFGLDDGNYADWSDEKKRAFGGVYRYRALTSVQRKVDWDAAAVSLRKAFEIDPTLTLDIDLFYDLAFGARTPGNREIACNLNLDQNYKQIMHMIANIFDGNSKLESLRKVTLGTANYAIGLVAYNINRRDLSRQFLSRALVLSPKLLLDQRIDLVFLKSFIKPSWIDRFKRFVNGDGYAG